MIYLICQDWLNTSTNHAGMKYLCEYLEKTYPNEFKTIVITRDKHKKSSNKILNRLNFIFEQYIHNRNLKQISNSLCSSLSSEDSVFLVEYYDPLPNQYIFSKNIKSRFPDIKIYGLSHLVPAKLDKLFSNSKLKKWNSVIDKTVTLGSSLTKYYESRGIDKNKIITTFHYVDDYYIKHNESTNEKLQIIAMGNQMRNTELLAKIVKSNPDVQFTICQGLADLSHVFTTDNVRLIPFVLEDELRNLMSQSDISLNVMYDTIGSNVIVTSMGMGLAMLCSDVGSIRDYCDTNNTIFCTTLEDFSQAISKLNSNRELVAKMKESAIQKSLNYSIAKFYQDLKSKL